MSDPVIKAWGPLKLTKTLIDPSDQSLSATDKEEAIRIGTVDCFPPPKATTDYVKPQRIVPTVQPRSLQQSDKTNFKNIKDLFGGKPATLAGVQTFIEAKLGFDSHVISYASKKLKALYQLVPCFTNDIYLRVKYNVYEIKVSAIRPVTLGADQFPAGDEIATYRIREIKDYRFESHLTWNKKCCEREPAETPRLEPTEYFIALQEREIEEVIVTGKKIKNSESAKPVPILPDDEKWEFKLEGGYKLQDKWEKELDLDWWKYLEDD